MKVYWKGKYVQARKAAVPVSEGPYFEGSALAEVMPVSSGKIGGLAGHAGRLLEGCRAMLMPAFDAEAFMAACRRVVSLNRLRRGSLRCRYFRDGALLIHPLPPSPKPAGPVRLITTSVRHYGAASTQGRVKSNSMLANWLAKAESQAWAEDGLRLTPEGYVAEGVWSNIVIERKGVLLTPPLHQGILEGVTRAGVIRRWKARGKPVKETPLIRHDLYTADRIWICSSLRGAVAVAEVDGRMVK